MKIVGELEKVPYLTEVVIGLDRADAEQYKFALNYFNQLPQHHRVLWNDGPRLRQIDAQLEKIGLAPQEMGKGRNVWYCLGYILASGKGESVALHDCDILTYNRELLARLIYPVANPNFNYEFCKGFYSRVANGRINGRVQQQSDTSLLIHSIRKCIAHISQYMTLERGDLVYTGTPGQTAAIQPGDVCEVEVEGIGVLSNPVHAG